MRESALDGSLTSLVTTLFDKNGQTLELKGTLAMVVKRILLFITAICETVRRRTGEFMMMKDDHRDNDDNDDVYHYYYYYP